MGVDQLLFVRPDDAGAAACPPPAARWHLLSCPLSMDWAVFGVDAAITLGLVWALLTGTWLVAAAGGSARRWSTSSGAPASPSWRWSSAPARPGPRRRGRRPATGSSLVLTAVWGVCGSRCTSPAATTGRARTPGTPTSRRARRAHRPLHMYRRVYLTQTAASGLSRCRCRRRSTRTAPCGRGFAGGHRAGDRGLGDRDILRGGRRLAAGAFKADPAHAGSSTTAASGGTRGTRTTSATPACGGGCSCSPPATGRAWSSSSPPCHDVDPGTWHRRAAHREADVEFATRLRRLRPGARAASCHYLRDAPRRTAARSRSPAEWSRSAVRDDDGPAARTLRGRSIRFAHQAVGSSTVMLRVRFGVDRDTRGPSSWRR